MKKKKVLAFIAAATILVVVLAGCAQKEEVKRPEAAITPSEQAKEYSLQEILNESQSRLSEEEYAGLFSGDVFLSELALRKEAKVTGDTIPPTVSIINPKKNEVISETKTITVFVLDSAGVAKVELYIDGKLADALTAPPYNFSWDTLSDSSKYENGTHTIKVIAYDKAGNTASDSRSVKIMNIQRLELVKDGANFTSSSGNVTARYHSYDKDDDQYYNIAHIGTYENPASIEYEFQLPYPNRYLYLDFAVLTKEIAGNTPYINYAHYDWALGTWVYNQDNASSGELMFWACEPYRNRVKIRVEVAPWSVAEIREVSVGYRYLPDTDTPTLTNISAEATAPIVSGNWMSFLFQTNEDVFVNVDVRKPEGTYVQNVTAAWRTNAVSWTPASLEKWADLPWWGSTGLQIAPPPAWFYGYCFVPWNYKGSAAYNGETTVTAGSYQYRLTVKDTAGHSKTSSWYNFAILMTDVSPPTISPF